MNKDKDAAHAQSAQWSTMPYARAAIKHPNQHALTRTFETERCPHNARQLRDAGKSEATRRKDIAAFKSRRMKGRDSPMVKKQRPVPVLKPTPALAAGPDRNAYNAELGHERKQARRAALIAEGEAARDDLHAFRAELNHTTHESRNITRRAEAGDLSGATKEAFKLMRRIDADANRVFARSRAFLRDAHSR